ncbi:MAG: KTSC domain-containing protein [Gammaproteobacteria bacterium]|nr:MAG: KTSC domain-containing protein [Gammaproteobacteria bacterium]
MGTHDWIKVIGSSQIEQYRFDESNLILEVEFKRGNARYIYHQVPLVIFEGMQAADSKGSFLNSNVKGTYEYTRLKEPVK